MKPQPVAAILHEWIASRGLVARLAQHQALALWPKVVGAETAAHSRAVGWREDTLVLVVDHSVWAQELSLRRQDLIERMNRAAGQRIVKDLLFRVGPLGPDGAGHAAPQPGTGGPGAADGTSDRQPPAWLTAEADDPPLTTALTRWGKRALARRSPAPCPCCTAPVETVGHGPIHLCPVCRQGLQRGGMIWTAAANLAREPWLNEKDMARRVPGLTTRIYEYAKEMLQTGWKAKLDAAFSPSSPLGADEQLPTAGALQDLALRYVMLLTVCQPGELTEARVQGVLGPYALLLFGDGEDADSENA